MAYVAGKSIEVMRRGEPVRLKPGDPVPEAATWRNLKSELAWKRVIKVPDSEAKTKAKVEPEVKVEEPPKDEEKPKRRGRKKKASVPWEE